MKSYQSGAIVAIFLAILATALTGVQPIGYSQECIDSTDNEADGFIDGDDLECQTYPFKDGNGESPTDPNARYGGESYASLFEYHVNYVSPQYIEELVCTFGYWGYYDVDDNQAALDWIAENGVDCSAYGF